MLKEHFEIANHEMTILDWIVVSFVLDDCSRWQVEHPAEGVPDAIGDSGVAGSAIPNW